MSKVAHIQRPLFGPWLDWNQLPNDIREQVLDVLTALYLEIVDVPGIAEQTNPNTSQAARAFDPSALPSMESQTDDALPH
jgi:hypothetical protein